MPDPDRRHRPRRWAGPAGATVLAALGMALTVGGIAIVVVFLPLVDDGGSTDGGVQLLNSVMGAVGGTMGIAITGCGVVPLVAGIWALVRPGEVALLVAAGIAGACMLVGVIPVLVAFSSGAPPDILVVTAIPSAASLVAACLLGLAARAAAREARPRSS